MTDRDPNRLPILAVVLALALWAGMMSTASAQSLPCDTASTTWGTDSSEYLGGDAFGDSHDRIVALGGDDRVDGFDWSDCLYGGLGSDQLFGGKNKDKLNGQEGTDYLYGGDAVDVLYGDADAPAAPSPDYLYGGADNDVLYGGSGPGDWCYGQGGVDTYHGCEHTPD